MDSIKTFLILAIAFLTGGAALLIIGLATHLSALQGVGPILIVLGIVFMVIAKFRKGSSDSSAPSPTGEA
ncbi:MAG: hypothetical protein QM769_13090 [Pseudoxanthomonas sp.]